MFLVVAPALAGKVVPPEGTWVVGSRVFTVGKKGKTLAVDGGEPEAAKLVAPGLLETASGTFQPFAVDGDRVWFADVVLAGDELVTAYGEWYHRTGGGFTGKNELATNPEQVVVEDGVLVVDGTPLYARSERVSTSTTVRAARGADAEAARRAARDLFVDGSVARMLAAAQGDWPPSAMGELDSLAGDQWRHTNGETYTASPLSPCHVDLVGADGSSWPRGLWTDGERLRVGSVGVVVGSETWVCEDDLLLRYSGGTCESFRFTPSDRGEPGAWDTSAGDCAGAADAPATSQGELPPTEQPGVFGGDARVRVSPALLERVQLPADLADRLADSGGAPLPADELPAAAGALRSAIAGCAADLRFDGRVVLTSSEPGFTFWHASPATADGDKLLSCAEQALSQDGGGVTVRATTVIRVTTPTPPARANVAVTPSGAVSPAVVALVTDAAAICAAEWPLSGPYVRSFEPQGGQVLGMTLSMGEGQVMPSSEHGACLWFADTDFPAGSVAQFEFRPR